MVAFERFGQDDKGNIGIVFALALIPVVALGGAAVDYTRAATARERLQAATDAAALAAATSPAALSDQQRIAIAENVFKAKDIGGAAASASVVGQKVVVTAEVVVNTTLMALMNVDALPVRTRSAATRGIKAPPACVLALNTSASGGLSFTGGAEFTAEGCTVHSNSLNERGLSIAGNAAVTAAGFCSAGGVATTKTIQPEPRKGCGQLPDPFATLSAPVSVGCDEASAVTVQPNETKVLQPGIYCDGLTLKGTATLTPGVYVVKGGLTINARANVTGAGVTLYLAGSQAGFTINGGAAVSLSAQKDGRYAGVLIWQDRQANAGATNTINGGADVRLVGAIYTPTQTLSVNGSSGFGQASQLMPIVADQIKFAGSTTARADTTGFRMAAPLPQFATDGRLTD